jgi:hypothetical protein
MPGFQASYFMMKFRAGILRYPLGILIDVLQATFSDLNRVMMNTQNQSFFPVFLMFCDECG